MKPLTLRIGTLRREHGQSDGKYQIQNRSDGNRLAENAGIKLARAKAAGLVSPHETTENGHAPGEIGASHSEREQGIGGGGIDECQQSDDDGHKGRAPDGPHRLVADAFTDMAKEAGKWKSAVASKGPSLARGSDDLTIKSISQCLTLNH